MHDRALKRAILQSDVFPLCSAALVQTMARYKAYDPIAGESKSTLRSTHRRRRQDLRARAALARALASVLACTLFNSAAVPTAARMRLFYSPTRVGADTSRSRTQVGGSLGPWLQDFFNCLLEDPRPTYWRRGQVPLGRSSNEHAANQRVKLAGLKEKDTTSAPRGGLNSSLRFSATWGLRGLVKSEEMGP